MAGNDLLYRLVSFRRSRVYLNAIREHLEDLMGLTEMEFIHSRPAFVRYGDRRQD
jgi:hypothetical protein